MTNSRIDLTAFHASWRGRFVRTLLGRHKIEVAPFMAEIHAKVLNDIEGIGVAERCKTELLCGPELWASYRTVGVRRCAGIVLAYMVEIGAIPLVPDTLPVVYPRRYRLR